MTLEAMKQTLKNGLFNGLKLSPNCDLHQEVCFGDPDFTDEKNLLPSSVWELSGFAPKQLDNSDESPSGWVFTLGSTWMSPPMSVMSPHLFPLSCLDQEIIVEGYNDNKPFVPFEELKKYEDNNNDNEWIYHVDNFIHKPHEVDWYSAPVRLKKVMDVWFFNTEGLPPESFIDASKSKVYEPKK